MICIDIVVNISSGDGLVLTGNKWSPESALTKIYITIICTQNFVDHWFEWKQKFQFSVYSY